MGSQLESYAFVFDRPNPLVGLKAFEEHLLEQESHGRTGTVEGKLVRALMW